MREYAEASEDIETDEWMRKRFRTRPEDFIPNAEPPRTPSKECFDECSGH